MLFDNLPEPIDLDLDLHKRMLYWTDRGDPPRGNTVNRALMDVDPEKKNRQVRRDSAHPLNGGNWYCSRS